MINKANIYEQLTALPYLSAYQQLIQGAIELDVFSELENPITVKELSEKMNWDESNTFVSFLIRTEDVTNRVQRDRKSVV